MGVEVTDASEEEQELLLPWPSPDWHTLGPEVKDATGCPVIPDNGWPLNAWDEPGVGECGAVLARSDGEDERRDGEPRRVLQSQRGWKRSLNDYSLASLPSKVTRENSCQL